MVLDRLASNNGELPTLLFAHNEEVRVTRQRMKQVRWGPYCFGWVPFTPSINHLLYEENAEA